MHRLECADGLYIIPDSGPRGGFWAGESLSLGRSCNNYALSYHAMKIHLKPKKQCKVCDGIILTVSQKLLFFWVSNDIYFSFIFLVWTVV